MDDKNSNLLYNSSKGNFDIKKIFFLILSNFKWILLSISICLSIAYVVTFFSTTLFVSSTSIVIKEKIDNDVKSILKDLGDFGSNQNKILNEKAILKSYYLTRKTLDALDFKVTYFGKGRFRRFELYKNSPFLIVLDAKHPQIADVPVEVLFLKDSYFEITMNGVTKKVKSGSWFINENIAFKIFINPGFNEYEKKTKYGFYVNDLNLLAKQYQDLLVVDQTDPNNDVLNLSIQGSLVEKNIDYLNKLSEVYIQNGIDDKNTTSINAIDFIDNQLSIISDSLQLTEADLQKFRQTNRIIDLTKEGSAMFDKLEEQQNNKALTEIKLKYYYYLLDYIKRHNEYKDVITPSVMGIEDKLLNELVSQLCILNQEKKVLEYSIKSNNPDLDVINLKIKNTISSIIDNVTNIIQGAKIELGDINSKISQFDGEIKKLPLTERQMITIQRKFNLNDNIYNFLLQRRSELGILKASNAPNAAIVDKADFLSSIQIAPKPSMNYLIALLIGFLFPAITLLVLDSYSDTIINKKDIISNTTIPIIGMITHNQDSEVLIVNKKQSSLIAESFRSVRTNLKFVLNDSSKAVISVTSSISGEGKTFISSNFAAILAASNKKVLLIGLDLRKPKIHKMFNIKNDKGITTILSDLSSLEETIISTEITNLDVLVAGPIPPNPTELIDSIKMKELLAKVKDMYDYVVLDNPPLALVSDAYLLNEFIDLNIYVVRHNYSVKNILPFVNSIYEDKKLYNLYLLINDIDLNLNYGYGYGKYGKYKRYGYGDYGYSYGYSNNDKHGYYNTDKINKLSFFDRLLKKLF